MDSMKHLQHEIEDLRYELAEVIPNEIQAAVDLGDLRENTDYSSVLQRQQFVTIRLEQLTKRLEAYKKISLTNISKDCIDIGSVVKIKNLKTNKIQNVKLVIGDISINGEYEEVTINSPMGKALRYKKEKDKILVNLPTGKIEYKILQFKTIYNV